MSLFKRLTSGTAIVGSAFLALGMACSVAGARINTSRSIPVGLYWLTERPIAKGEYELGAADLLLMTNVSSLSFDSRYFGLVKRAQIKAVIRPVFTW